MDNFKEGWGILCNYLREEKKIADVAYKTWISRIEPVGIDFEKGVITLMVPNTRLFSGRALRPSS